MVDSSCDPRFRSPMYDRPCEKAGEINGTDPCICGFIAISLQYKADALDVLLHNSCALLGATVCRGETETRILLEYENKFPAELCGEIQSAGVLRVLTN